MNREISEDVIKKTFWLLRRIKRLYQTFRFKEDDLQMVSDWAEILEPVIDWVPQGLTRYCRAKTDNKKKEPSVSDIFDFSYLAKTEAERSDKPPASRWEPKTCDNDRVDRLIDQKRDMLGITKEKPLPPADKDSSRKKQIEAARYLLRKKDLPFAPDEEDLPK